MFFEKLIQSTFSSLGFHVGHFVFVIVSKIFMKVENDNNMRVWRSAEGVCE